MKRKKGQVALWIIIALVIVAIIIALIVYSGPKLPGKDEEIARAEPYSYLQKCLEQSIGPALKRLGEQGGSIEPAGFIVYNSTKIPYLCYTSEYYKTCVVQQPNLYGQFERNLIQLLKPEAEACVKQLKDDFEQQGYKVASTAIKINSTLGLGNVRVAISSPMTITKEFSKTYQGFEFSYSSSMYELISLANSLLEFETTYGDSETTLYISYYPNIKIGKVKLSDGTKIYTLSEITSNERLVFASRSLSWPPGYGAIS